MNTPEKKPLKRRLRVWWHYHWISSLLVLCSLILLFAVIRSLTSQTEPDYRIGVTARLELPADTAEALKKALLPFCTDRNGDGRIVIDLAQYTIDFASSNEDTNAYSQMAGVIKLSEDLRNPDGCGIFLMEDAEGFIRETEALRRLDKAPSESVENPDDPSDSHLSDMPENAGEEADWTQMCYLWTDCPVLTALDLGSYRGYTLMDTQEGTGQDVMTHFYLGRKAIPADTNTSKDNAEEDLWSAITENAS